MDLFLSKSCCGGCGPGANARGWDSPPVFAHAGGRIEVCGDGRLNLSYAESSASEASINYGGTLEISGNGVYTLNNRMAAANSGLVHLKDSGKHVINKAVRGSG